MSIFLLAPTSYHGDEFVLKEEYKHREVWIDVRNVAIKIEDTGESVSISAHARSCEDGPDSLFKSIITNREVDIIRENEGCTNHRAKDIVDEVAFSRTLTSTPIKTPTLTANED